MKHVTHGNTSGSWILAFHEFINVLQSFIWVLVLESFLAQFLHCLLELLKCDGSGILGPGQSDRNPKTLEHELITFQGPTFPSLGFGLLTLSVLRTGNSTGPRTW